MRLLILGNWHAGSSCASFATAAEQEGHEVIRVGPRFTARDAGRWLVAMQRMEWMQEGEAGCYVADVLAQSPTPDIETESGAVLDGNRVPGNLDAVLSWWAYGETPALEGCPALGVIPNALIVGDSHTGHMPQQIREAARWSHLFLQFRPSDLATFGHPSAHWLPPAADPDVWREEACGKQYDVTFVGATDPRVHRERVALIHSLKDAGLHVHVAHEFGARAALTYNQSRIVLNHSLAGDLNLRVVEVMMTGACLVTDEVYGLDRPIGRDRGPHDLFFDGTTHVSYRQLEGPGECLDAIRLMLRGDDAWRRVGENARREVLARHTWAHRVREVLTVLGLSQEGEGDEGGASVHGHSDHGDYLAGNRSGVPDLAGKEDLAGLRVTVMIPAFGHEAMTLRLVQTVTLDHTRAQLLVVNDASPEPFDTEAFEGAGADIMHRPTNGGFAAAVNTGIRAAHGEVVVLLNNDTEPEDGWLAPLVEEAQRGGIAGALILNPDGSVQAAGLTQNDSGEWVNGLHAHRSQGGTPVDRQAVMGACIAARRDVLLRLGGLDEGFPSGGEDVDLCLRARAAGLPVRLVPASRVKHREGTTRFALPDAQARIRQSQERLRVRWGDGRDDAVVAAVPAVDDRGGSGPVAGVRAGRGEAGRPGTLTLFGPITAQSGGSLGIINHELESRLRPVTGHRFGIVHYWPGTEAHRIPDDLDAFCVIQPWEAGAPPPAWDATWSHPKFRELWVPSDHCRRLYLQTPLRDEQIRVIPNGVDTRLYSPEGPDWSRPAGQERHLYVLFVGGLLERKGIRELYAAWERAFEERDEVRLILKAQGGQTFYKGQDIRPPEHLRNVRVIDRDLSPGEMAALYRSADVVVQPYRAEGFCLPLLEAMATGRPVIYPGAGPALEFVPTGAGIKVGWQGRTAVDLLARAMRWCLHDRAALDDMGREGRKAALAYDWDVIAAKYQQAMEEVCGRG